MNIKYMDGETELWKTKARKEAYLMFPLNIIVAIFRLLLGIRIPGELIFTNKRIIFLYKKLTFCCIIQEEMVEYTMLSRLTSLSAGVKYGFLCFCKRDAITVNDNLDYFFKGANAQEIQDNISKVMENLNK